MKSQRKAKKNFSFFVWILREGARKRRYLSYHKARIKVAEFRGLGLLKE